MREVAVVVFIAVVMVSAAGKSALFTEDISEGKGEVVLVGLVHTPDTAFGDKTCAGNVLSVEGTYSPKAVVEVVEYEAFVSHFI